MDRELRVVLSARVFSDQKCFGPGVSQLLKRVDELHSLRAYGAALFEETFAFYNDIPKHELHRKEKTHD